MKFQKPKSKLLTFSISFLSILALLSIAVSFLNLDPNYFDPNQVVLPKAPSFAHIWGTDDLNRDMLLRAIYGARISLLVGILSVSISISVGVFIGLVSGYWGGWLDSVLMRFTDLMMALPTIFLILAIQTLLKPSIITVMAIIGLTGWMGVARLVRAEVLSLKERPFMVAIKARGAKFGTLIKHLIPHTLSPISVAATLGVASAILTESVLSFLGLGVQPPHASWGNMLENSLSYMDTAPWMTLIPGILITLTVLSLNFLGDYLQKRLSQKNNPHA